MTNNEMKIDIQLPYSVTMSLDMEPDGGHWRALQQGEKKISFENDIYNLTLHKTALEADVTGIEYILGRKDGLRFLLKRIEVAVEVSASDVQNIITPMMNVYFILFFFQLFSRKLFFRNPCALALILGASPRTRLRGIERGCFRVPAATRTQ